MTKSSTKSSATHPDLSYETLARQAGAIRICGVDEAGRGPLAGPVVAAAVILPKSGLSQELATHINDSKKLSAKLRERLNLKLHEETLIGVGEASVQEIDRINILQASLLAMRRAVEALNETPDWALIDGRHAPTLACPTQTVIRGDQISLSIAAASIVAKTTRDRIMSTLAKEFPAYGWERNAGYPTAAHLKALTDCGPTPHHRQSFAPVTRAMGITD
ncbi:Ribonuclease HII [Azospirillaceae bacterium]